MNLAVAKNSNHDMAMITNPDPIISRPFRNPDE